MDDSVDGVYGEVGEFDGRDMSEGSGDGITEKETLEGNVGDVAEDGFAEGHAAVVLNVGECVGEFSWIVTGLLDGTP